MATGKKKGAAGKRTQTKRGAAQGRGAKKEVKQQENFTSEIILWSVLAASILLFISNFGIGGTIGNAVSRFFFGIFGLIAYIFPVILLVGTFFAVSNKGNRIAIVKMVAVILFVLFLCLFMELIVHGSDVQTAVGAYRYSYENRFGGGFIGGLLAWLICPNFGLIGSYVIDAIVLIISLVLITERSALRGVQKGSKKVYESAKISNERYRERAEQRREERELRRMDRKVEGVALDTRVLPKAQEAYSDELSELSPKQPQITLPQVDEEQHVTLTSGVLYEEEREGAPSAFSDEALAALSAYPAQEPEEIIRERIAVVTESLADMQPEEQPKASYAQGSEEQPKASYAQGNEEQPKASYAQPKEQPQYEPSETLMRREEGSRIAAASNEESVPMAKKPLDETDDIARIAHEIQGQDEPEREYVFPPVSLLAQPPKKAGDSRMYLQETALKLQQTLKNFGVNVTITNISCGPAVTRYELQPEMGVKVSKIVNLADDIKLNLAAADIRIEAPIPGKAAVGIEVPNKENVMVSFRELVESEEFSKHDSRISFCVGKDIAGKVTVADIAKMPHLLIAGATGSGKSVCINTVIMSILYKADPKDVKLIMIDPKVVELSVYNGIPHLMIPVVTDPKKAAGALHWAVAEMTDRYQKFAEAGVRDLKGYNAKLDTLPTIEGDPKPEKLPQIVIIVDELADLMMVAAGDVEEAICRLAQLARACGIHLLIATQRPSVNVITGLIKANMPSRIAFAVTSGIDSRTILDMNGAEKLLGKGDMLFHPQGMPKPLRVQGAFVSDKEVSDVVSFLKEHNGPGVYRADVEEKMNHLESGNTTVGIDSGSGMGDGRDSYFADAARLLIDKEKGSIGMLQRYFKIGFNRAARIMDQLEEAGIVGPEEGTKPRRVLMSAEQFEQYEEEYL